MPSLPIVGLPLTPFLKGGLTFFALNSTLCPRNGCGARLGATKFAPMLQQLDAALTAPTFLTTGAATMISLLPRVSLLRGGAEGQAWVN